MVMLFYSGPRLQLGYLSAFTVVAIRTLVDFMIYDPSTYVARYRFPYSYISLGLLSLILTIYALTRTF